MLPRPILAPCIAIAVVLALALAGCGSSSTSGSGSGGGSGSGKPAYCADVAAFQSAVKGLKQAAVSRDVGALKTSAQKVQSTGSSAVSAAKSAFSSQTSGVRSALGTLGTTVKQLGDPATRTTALKQLPADAVAVSSAAKGLAGATGPKC